MNQFFLFLVFGILSLASAETLKTNAPAPAVVIPVTQKGVHNDQIYPPLEEASKSIGYDGSGFLINGQRKYFSSGTIHFARVPNELWRDRLMRGKNADFVNVESYVFWNYQEPRENEWNFSGDGDFEKFLNLEQELGLTAFVRIGPYVCAEWESGGWPLWLRFKPSMNLRTADPEFLKWNDHWYDKILPMVEKHQISKGGNVVLMQIENEHPLGWGVVENDPYFTHLKEQVIKHRIEIPWFFSGLNHGGNPSPPDIDPTQRKNPWMSTEFWAGWFDLYGNPPDKKLHAIDKANWAILAHGGGGHNFYMLHGGSNFDSWSDNSTGSSYDFGAAIGQAGDLRPSYYAMKRANLLAQSFPEIIASSTSAHAENIHAGTGTDIQVLGARKSAAGTLLFLRNKSNSEEANATLANGGSLRMARNSSVALPRGVILGKDQVIEDSTLPILCVARNEGITTVVFYGLPGQEGNVTVSTSERKKLSFTVSSDSISEEMVAGGSLRILVIPQDLSLRTWRLGNQDQQFLVFGPAFVRDLVMKDGTPQVTYERFMNQPSCGQVAVYGASGKKAVEWHFAASSEKGLESTKPPALSPWQTRPSTAPVDPSFDDSHWFGSEQPQQMGADGDNGSFAWYRAVVNAPSSGHGTLNIKGADMISVFLNGKSVSGKGTSYPVDLRSGKNLLAVFVTHAGRNKGFGYCKTPAALDPKGILGEVSIDFDGQHLPVTGWRMHGGPGLDETLWMKPESLKAWAPFTEASREPAFYRSTFTAIAPKETGIYPILRVKWTGLSRGMIWVNGHSLGRYPEKIHVDSLYIPEPWLRDGTNDIVVFDAEGASPEHVSLIVDTASREVIRTGEFVDSKTPFVVPQENPPCDLAAKNVGNIAYKAPATASSSSSNETAASMATDGDVETAWRAAGKLEPGQPSPWLTIDLGKPVPLGIVEIVWEGSSKTYRYILEGSENGIDWTKIGDETTAVPTSPDSISDLSRLNFKGEPYRHLRVSILAGKNPSIDELRVFQFAK